jgi:hypothetical protein
MSEDWRMRPIEPLNWDMVHEMEKDPRLIAIAADARRMMEEQERRGTRWWSRWRKQPTGQSDRD